MGSTIVGVRRRIASIQMGLEFRFVVIVRRLTLLSDHNNLPDEDFCLTQDSRLHQEPTVRELVERGLYQPE